MNSIISSGKGLLASCCFTDIPIFSSDNKKTEERTYGAGIDIPLAILINEESASASEILAGAIKDRECGTLVGKKTFGKGVVQGWYMIGDGTSIKLTIAKYFTPNGEYIHGKGISPDIEVDYAYSGPEDEVYDKQYDSQFVKALEVMKDMLKK